MTIVWVRALLRLEPMDRWLAAEAAVLVVLVRLTMALLRVSALQRALLTYVRIFGTRAAHSPVLRAKVAWAVEAVARRLPGRTSCLVEALVCQAMLQRLGFVPLLRLGVRRPDHAPLAAHAWVECDGEVVIGSVDDLRHYAPLAPTSWTVGGVSPFGR